MCQRKQAGSFPRHLVPGLCDGQGWVSQTFWLRVQERCRGFGLRERGPRPQPGEPTAQMGIKGSDACISEPLSHAHVSCHIQQLWVSLVSQLDLREKPGIKNVRKEEWARPKGSPWAGKKSGSNRKR